MPSYTTQERVLLIMRHLHKSQRRNLKTIDVAQALNMPQASVNKTINQDYPECFEKDSFGKGWILTGQPPVGTTWGDFDLEPPAGREIITTKTTIRDIPDDEIKVIKQSNRQMDAEHFMQGVELFSQSMKDYVKRSLESGKPVTVDEEYWGRYNFYNAGLIMMRALRSPDVHVKIKELVKGDVEL